MGAQPAWFLLAPPNPLQPEQGQETQKHLPQVQTTVQALQVLSSCHQPPVEELEPKSLLAAVPIWSEI